MRPTHLFASPSHWEARGALSIPPSAEAPAGLGNVTAAPFAAAQLPPFRGAETYQHLLLPDSALWISPLSEMQKGRGMQRCQAKGNALCHTTIKKDIIDESRETRVFQY